MTKDTTDELREQIAKTIWDVYNTSPSEINKNNKVYKASDHILALFDRYAAERENLARKKALNDITVWANNEMAKDWVRKELDGGQSDDR
jgi:hypothetical protein